MYAEELINISLSNIAVNIGNLYSHVKNTSSLIYLYLSYNLHHQLFVSQ